MMRRVRRLLDAIAVWAHLAAFGIVIGVLALLRNFERKGAGGRWRRAHATAAEVDALTRQAVPPAGAAPSAALDVATPVSAPRAEGGVERQ